MANDNDNNWEHDKSLDEQYDHLPSSDFGLPKHRSFPMLNAAHVRTAEAFFNFAEDDHKPLLAYRILLKAREHNVTVRDPAIIAWAKKYIDER